MHQILSFSIFILRFNKISLLCGYHLKEGDKGERRPKDRVMRGLLYFTDNSSITPLSKKGMFMSRVNLWIVSQSKQKEMLSKRGIPKISTLLVFEIVGGRCFWGRGGEGSFNIQNIKMASCFFEHETF